MGDRLKILFLCTGNSCRSQMAEGICRELKSDKIESFSAGTESHGLNKNAVKVMAEIGIDISDHRSKTVEGISEKEFDFVITVCGHANEHCPYFPAKTAVIHKGFDDPPKLALTAETEEQALGFYRRVRDEIVDFVKTLPESLYS